MAQETLTRQTLENWHLHLLSPLWSPKPLCDRLLSCVLLLRPRGLLPTRFLCPWDSPGKNTRVGSHSLLQGIFLTQGLNLGLLHWRQILYHLSQQGSPPKPLSPTYFVFSWRWHLINERLSVIWGFLGGLAGKDSDCNVQDLGLIPGLGRYPGVGKGYPLQYSGLENSMEYIVHGVTKSRTRLEQTFTFTFQLFW